jgi:hypothetical protein
MEQKNEEPKKYRVAIIDGEQIYEQKQYEDISRFVCNYITQWDEVTEAELEALKWYCSQHYGKFKLVIHYDGQAILAKAIPDYLKWAEKEKARVARLEAEQRKRALKSAQEAESRKRKRLEKLAAEAGLKVVPKT